jgi:glycosyltransferase involved in cell wall biosynthesis
MFSDVLSAKRVPTRKWPQLLARLHTYLSARRGPRGQGVSAEKFDPSPTRVRVLHLVSHPIQYFAPLYRCLAARRDLDLTVGFYSDAGVRGAVDPGFQREIEWDVRLLDGYRHWFLDGAQTARSSNKFSFIQQHQVVKAILRLRYDVIWLHGYNSLNTWSAAFAANLSRVPVLLREEATLLDRRAMRIRVLKALILPLLTRSVDGGLYIGTENRRFFERYGFPKDRLFFAPYSVDNDFFQRQADLLADKRDALKSDFGIDPRQTVVLFCGKLIPKKDPWTLMHAFAAVRNRVDCALLLVGDGPLRSQLAGHVDRQGIPNVHMTGFLNQSQISKAYAAADILVLPSIERETWGLVVNEAMNFGLPIVISDKVGCGPDLIQDGRNGLVFSAGSSAALADALYSLLSNSARLCGFGAESRGIIEDWSLERTAEGVAKAIRAVAYRRRSVAE